MMNNMVELREEEMMMVDGGGWTEVGVAAWSTVEIAFGVGLAGISAASGNAVGVVTGAGIIGDGWNSIKNLNK